LDASKGSIQQRNFRTKLQSISIFKKINVIVRVFLVKTTPNHVAAAASSYNIISKEAFLSSHNVHLMVPAEFNLSILIPIWKILDIVCSSHCKGKDAEVGKTFYFNTNGAVAK